MDWTKKTILVTGGTGSFGRKFAEVMLRRYRPRSIRIFSRDELKQWEMERAFNNKTLRFFIGDVRDRERLERAMDGVDIIVHAAALKQVPACEYNPFEAVKTNIIGGQNVIEAAIDHNVEKIMAISSDKAVHPLNLYGATKMCMEKLFIAGNAYVGKDRRTIMSCARYGNVVGSRGSVIPLFREQRKSGVITITDKAMTRFWITLEQGVAFVIRAVTLARGGEVFIPKIPSMKVMDLAATVAPECTLRYIGIRPGEKVHECLLTEDEARRAYEFKDMYVIEPDHPKWTRSAIPGGRPLPSGFTYMSDNNRVWLTKAALRTMARNA